MNCTLSPGSLYNSNLNMFWSAAKIIKKCLCPNIYGPICICIYIFLPNMCTFDRSMKCVNGLINFIYAKKKKKHLSSTLALDIKLGLAPFHAKHKCWTLIPKLSIEPLPMYGLVGVKILCLSGITWRYIKCIRTMVTSPMLRLQKCIC